MIIFQEALDDAAKKRRSERFGTATDSTVSDEIHRSKSFYGRIDFLQEDQQEKKRQRGERFHGNIPTSTVDEATKQKRIDRFGIVTPSTVSNIQGQCQY